MMGRRGIGIVCRRGGDPGAGRQVSRGGSSRTTARGRRAADGTTLLALALPDVAGAGTADSRSGRARSLVVNFWATWCAPCREEMPQFVTAQEEFGAKGLQFVGIAVDQADKVQAIRDGDRAQLSDARSAATARSNCRRRSATDDRRAAVHGRRRSRRARSFIRSSARSRTTNFGAIRKPTSVKIALRSRERHPSRSVGSTSPKSVSRDSA